jgi:tetratricopeptide (TPR) repeat protein
LVSVLAVEKKSYEIEAAYADWLREVRVRLRPEDHALTAHLLYDVAGVLLEGKKFTEGEQLAGECLALREKNLPDDWRTDLTRNLLGACLLGQERYAEAEPLLLAGYEGMKLHEANIPAQSKPRLKEVLQRLTQLYEATDRPDPAAEYRQRLVELERVLPSTQNVVPPTVKPSP